MVSAVDFWVKNKKIYFDGNFCQQIFKCIIPCFELSVKLNKITRLINQK